MRSKLPAIREKVRLQTTTMTKEADGAWECFGDDEEDDADDSSGGGSTTGSGSARDNNGDTTSSATEPE